MAFVVIIITIIIIIIIIIIIDHTWGLKTYATAAARSSTLCTRVGTLMLFERTAFLLKAAE